MEIVTSIESATILHGQIGGDDTPSNRATACVKQDGPAAGPAWLSGGFSHAIAQRQALHAGKW